MDIRQIQALHARYSQQPVIIDIAGHTAAMPALPTPDGSHSKRWGLQGLRTRLSTGGRPVLVCIAVAALAGGGGISAAKIWRVLHERGAVADAPAGNTGGAVARAVAPDEAPVNATPPRPLTAYDFRAQPSPSSALARVDARSLAMNAQHVEPLPQRTEADAALAAAAAAPIRQQHSASAAQKEIPPAAVPSVQPASVPATAAPTMAAPAAAGSTSPAVSAPSQRPAVRPLRHMTSHRAARGPDEPAPQPQPPSAAVKSSDVQLF